MNSLSNRLGQAMKEVGYSQAELARRASTAKARVYQQNIQQILSERNKTTSKHLPALARALGVNLEWLVEGRGPKKLEAPKEALLVGEIGAGDRVFRMEEGVVIEGGIEPPAGYSSAIAARIRGNSMRPLEPGWLVFYEAEHRGDPLVHLNKLCAIGLQDGTTYIKKLTRKGNKFVLKSWNADDIVDAKVVWASPVIEIRIR